MCEDEDVSCDGTVTRVLHTYDVRELRAMEKGHRGSRERTRRVSVRGHGDTSRWRQENMPCTGHEDIA